MGRSKPPRPAPTSKAVAEATTAASEAQAGADGEQQAAKEDLPILPKASGGSAKGDAQLGSTSAVEAGKGQSQLSILLRKQVIKVPPGGLPQDSDLGGNKRVRDEEKPPTETDSQVEKKPKKSAVLNRDSVRTIVREETESARAAYRADLTEAIETALSSETFRKTIREEVRAVLGFGPSETFQEAVGLVYTEALRTGLTDALRAVGSKAGFPGETLRTDPVAVARWSSLEASLVNLEKLVKSRADADTLREAKNAILDVKSAADSLKVGGSNLEQRLDQIRSMLASLPPPQTQSMMQPFAQLPTYANPWQQHPSSGSGPGTSHSQHPNPTPTVPNDPPTFAPANQVPTVARGAGQQSAFPHTRRAYDNDFPKNELLAIRTTNTERSLPHSSPAMQSLLRKADYPDNAINAAECYIPLRSKTGTSDVILTYKVCFPSAGLRAGFLDLAQNPKVTRMLNALDLSIEEWKDKADLMLDRQMRFSANIARSAESELAAQFSKAASAFTGPK